MKTNTTHVNFTSIPSGIFRTQQRIGVVGATDGDELAGRKTQAESLMIIRGHEFTVFWDELPGHEFVSEFMRRLE